MRYRAVAAAFLCAGLACAGTAGAAPRPDDADLAQQVADLKGEVLRLRQESKVAEVEMARLRQVITRLEAELAAAREQLERRPPPRPENPDVSETGSGSLTPAEGVEEEVLTDEEMDDPAPPEAAPPPAPAPAPPPPPAEPRPTSAAARTLYDESYTLFHEKSYVQAERGFRRFLELYPDTELADNAQFWIGESLYAQSRFQEALDAFLATVEQYPDGNKVADAIYKAGRTLEALGDPERAIATYEEAVRRFPASSAAASAQERLLELR